MKKSRICLLVVPLLSLPGCWRQKVVQPSKVEVAPTAPVEVPAVPVEPKKITFSSSMLFKRKADGVMTAKTVSEIIATLQSRVLPSSYLAAAHTVLFATQFEIDTKIILFQEMQKLTDDKKVQKILSFFETVFTENRDYLTQYPLIDINTSLVSPSPDSSDFIKDHPEISSVIWTLNELFSKGNTLLQEAVRKNNLEAVRYLLAHGANPRYLDDPRGPVLALEWADKQGYTEIANQLTKDINTLRDTKTTLLDELLYQDPNAARLVQKYGGKTAIELLS